MLVTSMVGYQLENMKKSLQPIVLPLKKFKNPPEFQCLGFNFTNVMVKVNKGFIQLNGNYIRITPEEINAEFCKGFEERASASPMEIFRAIAENPLTDEKFREKLFKNAPKAVGDTKET